MMIWESEAHLRFFYYHFILHENGLNWEYQNIIWYIQNYIHMKPQKRQQEKETNSLLLVILKVDIWWANTKLIFYKAEHL